jgi:hypothetical protein
VRPVNVNNTYIKRTRRMLCVCAWCGKVRRSNGKWEMPAIPARETSRLALTHGICPVCVERVLVGDDPGKAGGRMVEAGRKR